MDGLKYESDKKHLGKEKIAEDLNMHVGVVATVLDFNIIIGKFKHQPCYCVHFPTPILQKGMNCLILQAMD